MLTNFDRSYLIKVEEAHSKALVVNNYHTAVAEVFYSYSYILRTSDFPWNRPESCSYIDCKTRIWTCNRYLNATLMYPIQNLRGSIDRIPPVLGNCQFEERPDFHQKSYFTSVSAWTMVTLLCIPTTGQAFPNNPWHPSSSTHLSYHLLLSHPWEPQEFKRASNLASYS